MSRPDIVFSYAMLVLMAIAIQELQAIKDSARSFSGLMSLYENNYIRFYQLVDNLREIEVHPPSTRSGEMQLHLEVLEKCRYTTTVLLTYQIATGSSEIRTPDLKIRLYHDTRQAEVLSCCRHDVDSFLWLERSASHTTVQWRWRINHFLFKWLNHCLKTGHHFPQQKHGISWEKLLVTL